MTEEGNLWESVDIVDIRLESLEKKKKKRTRIIQLHVHSCPIESLLTRCVFSSDSSIRDNYFLEIIPGLSCGLGYFENSKLNLTIILMQARNALNIFDRALSPAHPSRDPRVTSNRDLARRRFASLFYTMSHP